MSSKKYWLMKTEPLTYSIEDLKKEKTTLWDGVRNYQARNFMMNDMQVGDEVLFYHSSSEPPGVAGLAIVSAPAQADPTQWDKKGKYYDAKSSPDKPRWFCVEVKFKKKFKKLISIDETRKTPGLKNMALHQRGQRLSVQPVSKKEFDIICELAET